MKRPLLQIFYPYRSRFRLTEQVIIYHLSWQEEFTWNNQTLNPPLSFFFPN